MRHSPSRQALSGKKGYQYLVQRHRPHPTDHFLSRIQYRVQIRHPITACFYILLIYTWQHYVPHRHCSFLLWGKYSLRSMVVRKFLSLRHQQAPSCRRKFLGSAFVISWMRLFTVRVTKVDAQFLLAQLDCSELIS